MEKPIDRRRALTALGGAGLGALLAACGGKTDNADSAAAATDATTGATTTTTPGSTAAAATAADCPVLIPEETAGPYPLDLSDNQQYFRRDITAGKPGLPLTLTLTMLNVNDGCAPLANARVDVWHCDKDGVYSGYQQPGTSTVGETFCRGIQLTDKDGKVTFTTIYPGWYPGRITHIHFQVFLNNGLAATSQLAFPPEITTAVYDTADYAAHGQNTTVTDFSQDGVFSDGTTGEMLALEKESSGGYVATLTVGIAA